MIRRKGKNLTCSGKPLRIYHPGLWYLCILPNLIPTIILSSRYNHYHCFANEETKAQRDSKIHSRSQSQQQYSPHILVVAKLMLFLTYIRRTLSQGGRMIGSPFAKYGNQKTEKSSCLSSVCESQN